MLYAYGIPMGTATCFPFHWPSVWNYVQRSFYFFNGKSRPKDAYMLYAYGIPMGTATCFPVHCLYLKADAHLVVSLFLLEKRGLPPKGEKNK